MFLMTILFILESIVFKSCLKPKSLSHRIVNSPFRQTQTLPTFDASPHFTAVCNQNMGRDRWLTSQQL